MSVTVRLSIPNISCDHCTKTVVRETKDLPGVENVEADVESKSATFTLKSEADLARVKQTRAVIGYPAVC
jgi:copper chaperone CopZ